MDVDVLADTPDVSIYHLKGFLEPYAEAVLANQNDKEQRLKELWPQDSVAFDAPLIQITKLAEEFVQEQLLEVELNQEKPGEPLRLFQYGESQIHA